MNTRVSAIPAGALGKSRPAPHLFHVLRQLFAISSSCNVGQPHATTPTRLPPAPAAGSVTRDIDKIWGHTVKRAREGSPFHRQTLALLDRDDRLAIESACGSWRG
jgi:hypothetical protein